MTDASDKYVRVYYDKLATEYPTVWDDPTLFWTWSRLLVVAEKMWPSVPEVPRLVKPRAIARLVELGIVSRVESHGFRIRGLDAERTKRHESARKAAVDRWANATGSATGSARGYANGNAEGDAQ